MNQQAGSILRVVPPVEAVAHRRDTFVEVFDRRVTPIARPLKGSLVFGFVLGVDDPLRPVVRGQPLDGLSVLDALPVKLVEDDQLPVLGLSGFEDDTRVRPPMIVAVGPPVVAHRWHLIRRVRPDDVPFAREIRVDQSRRRGKPSGEGL